MIVRRTIAIAAIALVSGATGIAAASTASADGHDNRCRTLTRAYDRAVERGNTDAAVILQREIVREGC